MAKTTYVKQVLRSLNELYMVGAAMSTNASEMEAQAGVVASGRTR